MIKKSASVVLFILLSGMLLFVPSTDTFASEKKAVVEKKAATEKKTIAQGKVNINTASVEELSTLKGIGEKTAKQIIEHRKKEGPFKTPEDIMKVKGIGEKKYKEIKDHITAGPAKGSDKKGSGKK